jgi:flagellar basal body-associated protein FliL
LLDVEGAGNRALSFSPSSRIPHFRETRAAGPADRKAMNATLSTRQIRVVALGVLVVVLVGGYMAVTHKSTTTTTAPPKPAHTTQATTTPTPSKTHTQPATLNTHGLPIPVAHALQKHSVVVVALTTPHGADEQAASAEAQAGATQMHAGFVAIDVFHQQTGTAILRKLGVVDTPEVLVIRRSGAITSQFKGFVDRDVVAQAVADAR